MGLHLFNERHKKRQDELTRTVSLFARLACMTRFTSANEVADEAEILTIANRFDVGLMRFRSLPERNTSSNQQNVLNGRPQLPQ